MNMQTVYNAVKRTKKRLGGRNFLGLTLSVYYLSRLFLFVVIRELGFSRTAREKELERARCGRESEGVWKVSS